MGRKAMEEAGVDNSFKKFSFKGKQKNGMRGGIESRGDTTAYLYIDGDALVQRD